jgi:hypothetical protein
LRMGHCREKEDGRNGDKAFTKFPHRFT